MGIGKRESFPPVTLGHIRSHGCQDLLVYCISGRCHHSKTMNADWLADETPVRSLCGRMVCTECGMIGADVRPDWSPHSISGASKSLLKKHPTSSPTADFQPIRLMPEKCHFKT
jgi:hypothetical protein